MDEQPLSATSPTNPTPDIPRDVFVEENASVQTNKAREFGIEAIYNFLLEDFEALPGFVVSPLINGPDTMGDLFRS